MTSDDAKKDSIYRRILDEKGLDGLLDKKKEGDLSEENDTPEGNVVPENSSRAAFPLNRIFNCTLEEYIKYFNHPTEIKYLAINLVYREENISQRGKSLPLDGESLLMKFTAKIPSGIDVVVNFRSSVAVSDEQIVYSASGIAVFSDEKAKKKR